MSPANAFVMAACAFVASGSVTFYFYEAGVQDLRRYVPKEFRELNNLYVASMYLVWSSWIPVDTRRRYMRGLITMGIWWCVILWFAALVIPNVPAKLLVFALGASFLVAPLVTAVRHRDQLRKF